MDNVYARISKKFGVDPGDLTTPLGLPLIRGEWYYVDPTSGNNTSGDGSSTHPFADVQTAYAACSSGAGDGIVLLSRGTGTASQTTSYLDQPLVWSKHGITTIGVSSGTRLYGRARIANVARTTGALTTIAFPTATTITDSANGFITAGFEVGNVLRVTTTEGTNSGTGHTITAVTAGVITCAASTFTVQTAATAGESTINSYNAEMIIVSGSNNAFYNIHVGNFSSDAAALGCLKVTGHRNNFVNCHFIGAGHAAPAAETGAYDLELNAGQENTFERCTFGTDTIIRAAANGNIRFDTNVWRSRFYECEVLCYSETAGKGAILSVDATALEGIQVFRDCQFLLWNTNGIGTSTSAFIGTKPTSGAILMDNCSLVGWAAWDSVGGNDMVYVVNSDATASGAGGIATTP